MFKKCLSLHHKLSWQLSWATKQLHIWTSIAQGISVWVFLDKIKASIVPYSLSSLSLFHSVSPFPSPLVSEKTPQGLNILTP